MSQFQVSHFYIYKNIDFHEFCKENFRNQINTSGDLTNLLEQDNEPHY